MDDAANADQAPAPVEAAAAAAQPPAGGTIGSPFFAGGLAGLAAPDVLRGARALVANPDPRAAEQLCGWLCSWELEVACTGDALGAAGLLAGAIVTGRPYRVVVCELTWPEGVPPALAAHLWQLEAQGQTGVVLTCAAGDADTGRIEKLRAEAGLGQMIPVLRAPFDGDALLAAISARLEGTEPDW